MRIPSTALLLVSLLSFTEAEAATPEVFRPTGKWNVNYEADQCVAAREYASDRRLVTLGFEAQPLQQTMRVLLQTPGREPAISFYRGSAQFGAERLPLEHIQSVPSVRKGWVLHTFGVNRDLVIGLEHDGRFGFASPKLKVELPVTSVGLLMRAMDDCVAHLLESWGMSQDAQAQMASPPKPLEGRKLLDHNDYPGAALRRGGIGEVQVRMSVRPDGTPADCRIVRSSGHEDLDTITCAGLLKRGRFHPALDKAGRPMESPYFTVVNWAINQ